ncbi:MAG TPA: ATP-binding cassette domain-containing protein, partial [Gemmatimonadaceae bacterium]
ARVLILDEPTAVLPPREAQELYRWLRGFVARGRTVVLITHKVREALAVADAVTVLRRGRTVLEGPAAGLAEGAVVQALLGSRAPPIADEAGAPGTTAGEVVLDISGVSVVDDRGVLRLSEATLAIRSGEIVGVAGVEGAGHAELLRVLAGRLSPAAGTVRLPRRIGFVPEDRLRDALIPTMTLVENFALRDAGLARGIMPWSQYVARTHAAVRAHDVRSGEVTSSAATLSGGNQQKFVLARELEDASDALIVEHPTRGLDIRAAADVLARLRAARSAGVAIVVSSNDLDEVLAIADRIVVCFEGRLVPVVCNAEAVARAMVGLA